MATVKINTVGSNVTNGTTGSVVFIGVSGVLSQDSAKFFWDDTNYSLNLSGTPALYKRPNISVDSWFIGGAGNFTTTGDANMGMGAGALSSLDDGGNNVGIGNSAGEALVGGTGNLFIGSFAGQTTTNGKDNVGIGAAALVSMSSFTGRGNVAIGSNVMQNWDDVGGGGFNVAVGTNVYSAATGGFSNTFVGTNAASSISGGTQNTWVGGFAGSGTPADTINLSNGDGTIGFDFGLTTSNVWSFMQTSAAMGIHIYKSTGGFAFALPTNYERAVFDWNITSNVLTIGTQAGGTGSTRNLQFIIGGTNKLDYGVTNAGKWTFAAPPVVPAFTVSTLPTGVTGAQAYVTDGDAGLAWGATVINSGAGATKYLVWYNGANWTVVGK